MNFSVIKHFLIRGTICLSASLTLSWVTPITISGGGSNYAPYVDANDSGKILVVWTNDNYPNSLTQGSFFDGSTWSSPETINGTGSHVGSIAKIDSLGNAVVLWECIIGNERLIVSAQKPVGYGWGSPVTLSTSNLSSSVCLGMNPNGEVIAGWIDLENSNIQVATLSFGGSWSSVTTVASDSEAYFGTLQLGIDDSGNGVLVWGDYNTGILYSSQTSGGLNSSWSTPAAITSSGINISPIITVTPLGNAIAAWTDIETYEVSASIYESGAWESPVQVSDTYAAYQTVAASEIDYFIAWNDLSSGGTNAAVTVSGIWDTPFSLSNNYYEQDDAPQSSFNSGTYFTAWTNCMTGEINVADYPLDNSSPYPVVISNGDLNFNPVIGSSATTTAVAWVKLIDADYVIQVNTN